MAGRARRERVRPKNKKPGFMHQHRISGRGNTGTAKQFCSTKILIESMMDRKFLQKIFSNERTQKYFDLHQDEAKAIKHYLVNLYTSEAFYPVLSILEVALRNSLNRELNAMFSSQDWYARCGTTPGLSGLNREITLAISHITKRGESVNSSKVVAELTLGFWVRLFNVEYELILWKDLRRAFPFMPKTKRQRHNVSAALNKIRNFRNRVYHNEPIAWNIGYLESIHAEIHEVISWLNKDLPTFAAPVDRLKTVLKQAEEDLK